MRIRAERSLFYSQWRPGWKSNTSQTTAETRHQQTRNRLAGGVKMELVGARDWAAIYTFRPTTRYVRRHEFQCVRAYKEMDGQVRLELYFMEPAAASEWEARLRWNGFGLLRWNWLLPFAGYFYGSGFNIGCGDWGRLEINVCRKLHWSILCETDKF
jgi:hypothetical protein